ncbi:hypothetical protein IOC57_14820 [Bacillus sp. SD075]|uniref:hypothetical protein n=1 Tax=Bacillus sp. SD075 TaxID=2781732 RepID=UPI001A96F78B|nr:hypothetical protein [Bacillus sp. SD075]MBO0999007.1 hypothetical protein [Bacillus sp. SD075]
MGMLDSKGGGGCYDWSNGFPDTRLQIENLEKKFSEWTKGTFFAGNNHLHFD